MSLFPRRELCKNSRTRSHSHTYLSFLSIKKNCKDGTCSSFPLISVRKMPSITKKASFKMNLGNHKQDYYASCLQENIDKQDKIVTLEL